MKIQTPEQLGAAIRARRKALGLTQKELAMACGTGLRFLVDLEKGKPTCQLGKALEVLRALGLAVETAPFGGVESKGAGPWSSSLSFSTPSRSELSRRTPAGLHFSWHVHTMYREEAPSWLSSTST